MFVGRSAADDRADCPSLREQKQQTRGENHAGLNTPSGSHRRGWNCRHNRVGDSKRCAVGINLAIVEPEHDHYYQPAFTLVGAGVYPLARTRRAEESLIPVGVQWICNAAQTFEPEKNTVRLRTAIR